MCARVCRAQRVKRWEASERDLLAGKASSRALARTVLDDERQAEVKQLQADRERAAARAGARGGGEPLDEGPFWRKIAYLERELATCVDDLDRTKRELYFPPVKGYRFTAGTEGVYIGMEDFWLEEVSGHLVVNVVPAGVTGTPPPKVTLAVEGAGGDRTGMFIRGRALGVQVKGEKGTRVPSLKVDSLTVGFEVVATMPLHYSMSHQAWRAGESFRMEVVQLERKAVGLKVPLPRSIVKWLINWIVPDVIKKLLLEYVPPELGRMLYSSQQRLRLRALIGVQSLSLDVLDAPWETAEGEPYKRTPGALDDPWASPAAAAAGGGAGGDRGAGVDGGADGGHGGGEARAGDSTPILSVATPAGAPTSRLASHAAAWVGLSAAQAKVFVAAQCEGANHKSPAKAKALHCLADLLAYVRKYGPHEGLFHVLDAAWQQTLAQFAQEHETPVRTAGNPHGRGLALGDGCVVPLGAPIVFSELVDRVVALAKMPVRVKFEVQDVDCRVELENLLLCVHDVYARVLEERQTNTAQAVKPGKAPPKKARARKSQAAAQAEIMRRIESGKSAAAAGRTTPDTAGAGSTSGAATPSSAGSASPTASRASSSDPPPLPDPAGRVGARRLSFSDAVSARETARRLSRLSLASELDDDALGLTSAADAAAGALDRQVKELEEWYDNLLATCAVLQTALDSASVGFEGSLAGGADGQLLLRANHVQLQAAPGLSLPIPLPSLFLEPTTYAMDLKVNSDRTFSCDILVPSVARAAEALEAAAIGDTHAGSGPAVRQRRAREASDTRPLAAALAGDGGHNAMMAAAAAATGDMHISGKSRACVAFEAAHGRLDALTVISLKSAWLGVRMRFDPAALAWAKNMAFGSPPELDVLSVDFRAAGTSADDADGDSDADADADDADGDAPPKEPSFTLSVGTVPLARLCLDAQEIELTGSLQVLQDQARAVVSSMKATVAASSTPTAAARTPTTAAAAGGAGGSDSAGDGAGDGAGGAGLKGFEELSAVVGKYLRSEDLHFSFLLSIDFSIEAPPALVSAAVQHARSLVRSSRGHIVVTQPQSVIAVTSHRIKVQSFADEQSPFATGRVGSAVSSSRDAFGTVKEVDEGAASDDEDGTEAAASESSADDPAGVTAELRRAVQPSPPPSGKRMDSSRASVANAIFGVTSAQAARGAAADASPARLYGSSGAAGGAGGAAAAGGAAMHGEGKNALSVAVVFNVFELLDDVRRILEGFTEV